MSRLFNHFQLPLQVWVLLQAEASTTCPCTRGAECSATRITGVKGMAQVSSVLPTREKVTSWPVQLALGEVTELVMFFFCFAEEIEMVMG